MKVLHIDTSILASASVSRQLSQAIIDQLKLKHSELSIDYLDLAHQNIPHLNHEILMGQEPEQTALTEKLVQQYLDADIVVVGAAMYNFGLSSALKAWIDRICAAGRTFKYTSEGSVGLSGDKTIYIASSRGGIYGENHPADFQEAMLKTIFNFTGVSNIQIIRAEGVNMGEALKEKALADAFSSLQTI
ncbi:FMN-dependent NADH-azoreductase [Acinetobacter calcoaceticus]|uniref:FMN dependent NADH:quinone oxidoreductase n=1 Tax=Acinetobacter calcoaceticus TaxID=471 RepID=A0A4R1XII0_ACICA|nr:FMN-dependent NADH-azoreductase [Acinetobacter calcoaceticus]